MWEPRLRKSVPAITLPFCMTTVKKGTSRDFLLQDYTISVLLPISAVQRLWTLYATYISVSSCLKYFNFISKITFHKITIKWTFMLHLDLITMSWRTVGDVVVKVHSYFRDCTGRQMMNSKFAWSWPSRNRLRINFIWIEALGIL
jgi:hypothetical protein